MAGLPFTQLGDQTPESVVDNNYQQGLAAIHDRYEMQWNEVNRRAPQLGQRRQMEMLEEIRAKSMNEISRYQQEAQLQANQIMVLDKLAEQGGFDATKAKWRIAVGPDVAETMFPREKAEQTPLARFNELQGLERELAADAARFIVKPGERIPEWFTRASKEKRTPEKILVADPGFNPVYDKKEQVWVSGGHREATPEEIEHRNITQIRLKEVRRALTEQLSSQPDIVTRVQSTMLRTKRDPAHDSLTTKVKDAAGLLPEPQKKPRQSQPERQVVESPTLTTELAKQFLSQAGGDKDKARKLAQQAGYKF